MSENRFTFPHGIIAWPHLEAPLYLGANHSHKWVDVSPNVRVWGGGDGKEIFSGADWQRCHCGRMRKKDDVQP